MNTRMRNDGEGEDGVEDEDESENGDEDKNEDGHVDGIHTRAQ